MPLHSYLNPSNDISKQDLVSKIPFVEDQILGLCNVYTTTGTVYFKDENVSVKKLVALGTHYCSYLHLVRTHYCSYSWYRCTIVTLGTHYCSYQESLGTHCYSYSQYTLLQKLLLVHNTVVTLGTDYYSYSWYTFLQLLLVHITIVTLGTHFYSYSWYR